MKVDVRLPGKGNSNSHGTRPVHLIITMIKWIRTSRLSIKKSLSRRSSLASCIAGFEGWGGEHGEGVCAGEDASTYSTDKPVRALTGLSSTCLSMTGLSLTGLFLTGLSLTGLVLTFLSLTGLFLTVWSMTGLLSTGLSLTVLFLTGLSLTGLFLTGLSLTGLSNGGAGFGGWGGE